MQSPRWLSVLRQPAQQPALPKCLAPSPCLAVRPLAASSPASSAKVPHALVLLAARPSAVSVRFCAVASHSTGNHGRGCAATSWRSAPSQLQLKERFLASNKNSGRQHGEYLAQFPAWHLGLFWRSTRPLPNRLFKGTPTALASLRKCQARRPLTPALGLGLTGCSRGRQPAARFAAP